MDIFDETFKYQKPNKAKKAANRPKDQIDVIALEKIKKLREE